jgi:N-acetylneuraminic acid mutarotase
MPTARSFSGSTALGGKIYVVGGYNGSSYLNTLEVYDPATDTWSTKANMPTARGYLAVGVVNGKIYAVGGYDGNNNLSTVEEYDQVTDTWTTKQSMPTARRCLGIAPANGKIYAAGGYNGNYLATVEEYDCPLQKNNRHPKNGNIYYAVSISIEIMQSNIPIIQFKKPRISEYCTEILGLTQHKISLFKRASLNEP